MVLLYFLRGFDGGSRRGYGVFESIRPPKFVWINSDNGAFPSMVLHAKHPDCDISYTPHAAVEEIVEKVVEERIRPALSQIQERFDTQPQPQHIDSRLSRMEERIDSQFEQMRILIQLLQQSSSATTTGSQPPAASPTKLLIASQTPASSFGSNMVV
ncbi:hypothetical protein QQ045_024186 [Rhodiola kirilowii]